MDYHWANEDRIGVVRKRGDVIVYIDSGTEYSSAVADGPLPHLHSMELMSVTRHQARLALGPETCAELDAMAADPATPWAMRQTLLYAQTWQRLHPSMDEIGWALGYDAYQIDALFMLASTL